MELRHLRYFIAVAEELHFSRAALRLHIEQSPLSRSIKELEADLGIKLFERTTRNTRLTADGMSFLNDARNILSAVDEARSRVNKIIAESQTPLRIAITNNLAQPKLEELLTQCRRDEPKLELQLIEIPVKDLKKTLQANQIDAAISLLDSSIEGYVAEPIWEDSFALVLPTHHPLSLMQHPTIDDALQYPIILNDPEIYPGCYEPTTKSPSFSDKKIMIVEVVSSLEIMLMMIAAGYGIGFAISSQATLFQRDNIIIRSMASTTPSITTYIIHPEKNRSEQLLKFIARVRKTKRA
ncbi:LysR family transcriptional regulator [Pseudomonas sp. ABY48]|uniref:LysR family transcriptional regulator n=1 Tax=Pseudomonas sp. ABY48 TaxID=3402865 RepID=UPI003B430756